VGRREPRPRSQGGRWIRRALYWLAVTAVSIAVVVLLLQLIHSLDEATVGLAAF
jgi:hypothetical protein